MSHGGEHPDATTHGRIRGRAVQLNPANRFEPIALHVLGEHLDELAADCPGGKQVATSVFRDDARTIINRIDSPDLPMKWSINPYRGCEHGCVYCYARPGHEYFGLSCGLDFDTKIFAKLDSPELLRRELGKPGWRGESMMMSGVTDPYQPVERRLRITRACLEVMAECRQPVGIVTKSRLVTRDLDLLRELAGHGAASVALSITTLDPELARKMEPRASSPRDRLAAVRELSAAGIPVAVMTAPIVPGLNDREIPALLEAAAEAGARSAGYVMLRLPHQVKALFLDWVRREFPDRGAHIESLVRQMRGGALYDATPFARQKGTGKIAEQTRAIFKLFAGRHGLDRPSRPLNTAAFRRPERAGQIALFGAPSDQPRREPSERR